ncbi:MAG: BACON domain-containing protein [Candidatus Omnitrophota bacterium]
MKKNRLYIIVMSCLVAVGILGLSQCKRSEISDPDTIGPAGFRVLITGKANPATLYVQKDTGTSSTVTVWVKSNAGVPLANKTIIFRSPAHGYFEGEKDTETRITDSAGSASVTFMVPPLQGLASITDIWVHTIYQDDSRTDNTGFSPVEDYIPIRLVPANYLGIGVVPDSVLFEADSAGQTAEILVNNPKTNDILYWKLTSGSSNTTWLTFGPADGNTGSTFVVTIQANNPTSIDRVGYIIVQAYDVNDNKLTGVTATLTIIQKGITSSRHSH